MAHFGKAITAFRVAVTIGILSTPISCVMQVSAQTTIDANSYVFVTSQGAIFVELRPDAAPKTVANFLSYVNSGAYTNSFFHRLQPGFILQGGGYFVASSQISAVPQNAPVISEYNLPNTAGTLAIASATGSPNSATNQWFFNLADNTTTLNSQNQDQTVFGQIIDPTGYGAAGRSMGVLNAIAADTVINASTTNQAFTSLPVLNYTSGSPLAVSNLVDVTSIQRLLTAVTISNLSASTVTSGQTITWTAKESGYPAGASVFWACGPLPTNTQCTISPNPSVADSTGTVTATGTLKTGVAPAAAVYSPAQPPLGAKARESVVRLAAVPLSCLFSGLLLLLFKRRNSRFGIGTICVLLFAGMLLCAQGCSGGSTTATTTGTTTTYTTPSGTYSIVMAGTGGGSYASSTLSITVQ